jgi:RNA polymerase sigma-70 factor, ECF subfamily
MAPLLDLPNLPGCRRRRLAQQGRESAFRELVRRYERPVFSLIYRMVRDREIAEDLAQDAFIKVLNHIDRYRPEFKFSSWLFKIANNVAIDHLRRGSSTPSPWTARRTPDRGRGRGHLVRDRRPQENALDEIASASSAAPSKQAIGQLRPEYRNCIMLRHVEGRSYEEIAATFSTCPWAP